MIVSEALDRLSRDQEHVAGLLKQLRFLGIELVTIAEGEISELHVGLKGTMNALFLKDLGQKVHRGVEGRQHFLKDPDTGKRQARLNPRAEWVIQEVPELGIVDRELWNAVKARQRHIRHDLTHDGSGVRSERARRPVYLLSNLIKCGSCGGGFSKVSTHHYGCSNARNRGTCNNWLTIRRDVLEASVLSGLKTHLMHPDLVKEFAAEYHRELNRLNASLEQAHAGKADEAARIDRQIYALVEAIKDGMRTPCRDLPDEGRELAGRT